MRKQLFAGALIVAVPALMAASAMPLTFGSGARCGFRARPPSAAGALSSGGAGVTSSRA